MVNVMIQLQWNKLVLNFVFLQLLHAKNYSMFCGLIELLHSLQLVLKLCYSSSITCLESWWDHSGSAVECLTRD